MSYSLEPEINPPNVSKLDIGQLEPLLNPEAFEAAESDFLSLKAKSAEAAILVVSKLTL